MHTGPLSLSASQNRLSSNNLMPGGGGSNHSSFPQGSNHGMGGPSGGPMGAPGQGLGQGPPGGGGNGPPSGNSAGGGAEEPYDPLAALMAPPTRTYSRPSSMSTMPSYGSMTSRGGAPAPGPGGMTFFNPGAAPPSIGNMGQPGQPQVAMWTPANPTATTNHDNR